MKDNYTARYGSDLSDRVRFLFYKRYITVGAIGIGKMKSGKFAVSIPFEEIKKFCQRWKVKEFYLFGSVLRDDFNENSDIDVIVKFFPNSNWSWKILDMDDELEQIFGRKVDILNKEAIEKDNNWLRRKNILSTATIIYEQ